MKKSFLFVIMAVLVFSLAACGQKDAATSGSASNASQPAENSAAEELTIKHQLGETKVKKNPEKVVVFDFGTLDTLDKLGVEVTAVPQASVPEYLSKYKESKYQNAGGIKEPDFEKIAEIDPDLIIISGRQSDAYEELSKLGPTIYLGVDTKRYMESFKENATTIGQIFGKEKEVETELAAIDTEIKGINEKATANGKKALIILANEGKISAYGAGSRFGIIHDVFGFGQSDENIEVSTHGASVTFEYVLEKNPDILFVVDRNAVVGGEASAKESIENDLVKKTKAFQDGKIIYLDPNYWYLSGGGLLSVSEMVKEAGAALN